MKHLLAAILVIGPAGPAWAQDAEKKVEGKQDGGGVKKPAPEGEPAIPVKDVDTNGDGMISASELKAALGKLGGHYGEKKGVKPDAGEKKGVPDGPRKVPPKDGEGDKKAPEKEGEKKAPAKDGGDK